MKDSKLLALYDMLDALEYSVVFTEDFPDDRDGDCNTRTRAIRIRSTLTERPYRATVAHETAHAVFGDVPTMFGPVNRRMERRADEWAAHRLITPAEYSAAERHHCGNPEAIALDLNVTTDLVEVYQSMIIRLGDAVYIDSKMGAGQYAHRIEVA